MALTFNTILADAGIDPAVVQLVRHKDVRHGRLKTAYHLWRRDKTEFERYQALQSKERFKIGNFLASFVVTPQNETLFVGFYKVEAIGKAHPGTIDPLSGEDVSGIFQYTLLRDDRLALYVERVIIEWGQGYLSWVQHAKKQPKPILEIRRSFKEPDFPGYLKFISTLSEIEHLPHIWVSLLREARGVYVLTCPRTREHYVGSASGEGGFFERWLQHAAMSGDAVKFKSRDPSDYQVSILEVVGSYQDVLEAEYLWIRKLQSISMGLNGSVTP